MQYFTCMIHDISTDINLIFKIYESATKWAINHYKDHVFWKNI